VVAIQPANAAKHFRPHGPLRFCATGGYVVRKTVGLDISTRTTGIDIGTGKPVDTGHTSSGGLKVAFLALSREVGYVAQSVENQVGILVCLTF
jgi:hypothetical protein